MNFVESYLKHPHGILAFLLGGVVFGLISFQTLPLNLFPDANYPAVSVLMVWPGAAAKDVEDKVARRIEKELAGLDLSRKVKSVSRDGVAAISVEFDYKKSLDAAVSDVSAALNRVASTLPSGVEAPRLFRISDATTAVATLSVAARKGSHLDISRVRQLSDNELEEALLRVPEVAQVEVFGGYTPEVQLEIDPVRLAHYNLSLSQVASAIHSNNINVPAGLIIDKNDQILIKVAGEKRFKQELGKVVVAQDSKGAVHLRDVAKVVTTFAERQSFFHGNGKPAIGINILRPEKGHVTSTLDSLEKYLPQIRESFPALDIRIVDTQGNLIETSVGNLTDSLRDAIILTIIVILLILARIRMTLLAAISIPFTFLFTFAGMNLIGYELNIVTLTAIIVAVGLLVDDAIVVIENIDRYSRQPGITPYKAALTGTKEIFLADFAGTFTTLVVLFPVMFIGGYPQKILRPLAVVLFMALLASYFVSVTVIPLLSPRLSGTTRIERHIEKYLGKMVEFWLTPFRKFFINAYRFGKRRRLLLIGPFGVGLLVASLRVMPLAGKDLMPPMDTGIIKVAFETETNTSLVATEAIVKNMEQILMKVPGFVRMATTVGSEPGVVSFGSERNPQEGMITAQYVDRFHRKKSIWQIEKGLRNRLGHLVGLKFVNVFDYGATPLSSISAPVDVMISGPKGTVLDRLANKVSKSISTVRGLTSVSRSWDYSKREIHLKFDPEKLSSYGIDPLRVAETLQNAIQGNPASILRVPGEDGHVLRVRYPEGYRNSFFDLDTLLIPSKIGWVPLKELGNAEPVWTRSRFVRQNLQPVVDVLGYRSTAAISHIQKQVNDQLKNINVPKGYSVEQEGEIKYMRDSFGRLGKAMVLAVIFLYLALVPTFRSSSDPIMIMLAIPLAFIGVSWSMLITGRHFCMPASMGMILLAGITVNNSILLLNFINTARQEGKTLDEAMEGAIFTRTRPILMTALSTIVGMLPIAAERAIGLERLSPLAVVAIGGLMVSTLLTLVYVPLFYTLIENIRAKLKKAVSG
jgi:multidrug efflux pump subunit AcrB